MRGALYLVGLVASFGPLAACSTAGQARLQDGLQVASEVCTIVQADGPLLVALADANGVPIKATGKAQDAVAADCAVIGAVAAQVPPGAAPAATVRLPPPPS